LRPVQRNDTWQNTSAPGFTGAIGQDNFASKPVNSTINLHFIQHEPGPVSSTLMDKPFVQNLDECLRYYTKSWNFGVLAGTADFKGSIGNFIVANATSANGFAPFKKVMAKAPTVSVYNPGTGTVNTAYKGTDGSAVTGIGVAQIGDAGFMQLTGTGLTAGNPLAIHYVADTNW
jgi:hypothetical protein